MANQTTATKAIVAGLTGLSGVLAALTAALQDGVLSQTEIVSVLSVLVTAVVTVVGVYVAPNVAKTTQHDQEVADAPPLVEPTDDPANDAPAA